ncbi:MAG: hypothetical protein ACQCN4_11420 [Candidatus Bathyarchaeia archaeon]|jgi:hypothetical protein
MSPKKAVTCKSQSAKDEPYKDKENNVNQVFFPTNNPMIAPVKQVIEAKISLFQDPKNVICATSNAERQTVMPIANFTPRTNRSSGSSTTT